MAHKFTRRLLTIPAAASLLLSGLASSVLAQNSPVGSWDVVFTGRQLGVAQMTFANNFTLAGREIFSPPPRHHPSSSDLGDGGRTGVVPPTVQVTNFYGAADISGSWTYDTKGHVVGVFSELGSETTNGISFTAVVKTGSRITLKLTRQGHHLSGRGIPLAALADFTGDYYISGKRAGSEFVDIITLTPGTDMNSYDVVGVGPAYTLSGLIYVSGLKRLGYYSATDQTEAGLIRVVSGSVSLTKKQGTLIGISEDPLGGPVLNTRMRLSPPGQ